MICDKCAGSMKRTRLSNGHCLGILAGLFMLILGALIILCTFPTVIGPIIGALIMCASLCPGGKARKVWKCRACGYVFDRA